MHLPDTLPELQLLDPQRYKVLNELLGLVQDPRKQLGLNQVVKAIQLVRDAEASRLVEDNWTAITTVAAAGVTTVASALTIAAGEFEVVDAVSLVTSDAAARNGRIHVNLGGVQVDCVGGSVGAGGILALNRRAVMVNGMTLHASVDALGGADTLTIRVLSRTFAVGEYDLTWMA